jgi:hypothetical protein
MDTVSTMEHLFTPCTRLFDLMESQGNLTEQNWVGFDEPLQELNLDVAAQDFRSAERGFTYADLYAMVGSGDTIAWLTPHAAVMCQCGKAELYGNHLADGAHQYLFTADGKEVVAVAHSFEDLLEICAVVLRLLVASVVRSVILSSWICDDDVSANATSLAYLMEQCQSLNALTLLSSNSLYEEHCRVLDGCSRPDLKIELYRCRIAGAAAEAMAEVLGRNQGPTKLDSCYIDSSVLAKGLRGNSHLKSLTPLISRNRDAGHRDFLTISGALKENKGLVDLNLTHEKTMSDETWGVICNSLETHPTLEVLNLRATGMFGMAPLPLLAPAVLKSRIEALVNMLKLNMSIHTIPVMSFTESRSFLISRRIGSGRAFMVSKKLAQLRIEPRCWEERFLLYEPIPIAYGCCCRRMLK